jgi:hypothetical protein
LLRAREHAENAVLISDNSSAPMGNAQLRFRKELGRNLFDLTVPENLKPKNEIARLSSDTLAL